MQRDGLKGMRITNKGGRERQKSFKSILKERSLNNSIGINWELVRNANTQDLPQTY